MGISKLQGSAQDLIIKHLLLSHQELHGVKKCMSINQPNQKMHQNKSCIGVKYHRGYTIFLTSTGKVSPKQPIASHSRSWLKIFQDLKNSKFSIQYVSVQRYHTVRQSLVQHMCKFSISDIHLN